MSLQCGRTISRRRHAACVVELHDVNTSSSVCTPVPSPFRSVATTRRWLSMIKQSLHWHCSSYSELRPQTAETVQCASYSYRYNCYQRYNLIQRAKFRHVSIYDDVVILHPVTDLNSRNNELNFLADLFCSF